MNKKPDEQIQRKLKDVTIWSATAIVVFYFLFEPLRGLIVMIHSGQSLDIDKNWTAQIGTFAGLAVGILLGRNEEKKKCNCEESENKILDYIMKTDKKD